MILTEEILSVIIAANPGDFAIYRLDSDGLKPVFVSEGLPGISGMTKEEYEAVAGKNAAEIVLENDRPRVSALLSRILLDGKDVDFTYRILHKEKGFVWVHAKTRVIGTMAGRPVILSAFLNTSSESAEHEFLLGHAIANIYVLDRETRELLYINEPGLKSWGRGDYSGKRCFSRLCRRDTPCEWCPVPYLKDGFAKVNECFVPTLGRWYRMEAREMSWFGRPAVAVYAVDITRRMNLQQSLETGKSELEKILNNVPGGVAIFSEHDGSIRLDYTNDGFYSTHHGRPEYWKTVMGMNPINWLPESDRPIFWSEFRRVAAGEKAEGGATYRVLGEDGRYHWINNQFRLAYEQDGVPYFYSSFACIDEQKSAEEKLEESERTLQEAMSNSEVQFFTYFPGQHRCEIYAASTRLAELPAVWDHFPDDFLAYTKASDEDAEAYRRMLREVDEGADESECTVRFAYQGVYAWEKMRLRAIRDREGRLIRAQGHSTNVTELKKAEERFRQEQERLALLGGDVIESFTFNATKNTQARLRSAASIRYDGAVRSEVEQQAEQDAPLTEGADSSVRNVLLEVANQIPDRDQRALFLKTCSNTGIRKAWEEGKFSQTIHYRRKVGSLLRWVATSVEILPDPESRDLIAFFYTRDVHSQVIYRKVTEEIVARNYLAMSFYDVQTGLLYSWHADENRETILRGEPYRDVVVRELISRAQSGEVEELKRKLAPETILAELENKPVYTFFSTGSDRNTDLPGRPFRRLKNDFYYLGGDPSIIVMLLTDVTGIFEQERENRDKMETALAAAEQASVAKTEFLSRMSHEIRTPMNAIIGLDAIALQEKNLSVAMEDHLQKIGISARFLLSLINDILDMSRIESGRMVLTCEPFRFEELIDGINTIFYEQCRESGLDYDCVLKSFTEETYVGDRTKLQQVLVNILGNAVKFTPKGGKIHFLIEQVSRTREKARLRFEISDTGIGIDEEFLPHLFEAFSQENRGRTSAYGGTGLGLAISKNIVGLMGGNITVHSIKNVGSQFTVEVELGLTEETIRRREQYGAVRLQPLFTLIVDDDVIICRHTQMILGEAGLKAEWAESGERAVRQVREQHQARKDYDLILLDWKMPDMDGIETAREIRKIVGPEVTIIIMTAYDWVDIEERAKAAGVDLFMRKPVFVSSITRAFEHVYERKGQSEESEQKPAFDFTGKRVLLAEDNEINAEIATHLLKDKHCEVDTADNGATAIEAFATKPVGYYDAVLMDVRMPVMDGLEAARSIRAMKKADSRTVPIIAMTANAFQEDVNLSLKSGMNAHLAKPIEPELLYQTLARYLEKKE